MQQQIACFGCGKDIGAMYNDFKKQKTLHISRSDAKDFANSKEGISDAEREELIEFLTESMISDEDALTESGAIRECCRMTVLGQQDISAARVRTAGRPKVDATGKLTVVDIGLYDKPEPKRTVRPDAHKAIIPPAIAPDMSIVVPMQIYTGSLNPEEHLDTLKFEFKLSPEQAKELKERKEVFKTRREKRIAEIRKETGTSIEALLSKLQSVDNLQNLAPNSTRFAPGLPVTGTKGGYTVNFIFEHSIETKLVVQGAHDDTAKDFLGIQVLKQIRNFVNSPMQRLDVETLQNVKIFEMSAAKAFRILSTFRSARIGTSEGPSYAEVHDNATKVETVEGNTVIIAAEEDPTLLQNTKLLLTHLRKLLKDKTIISTADNLIVIGNYDDPKGDHYNLKMMEAPSVLESPFLEEGEEAIIDDMKIHDVGVSETEGSEDPSNPGTPKLFLLLENLNIIVIEDKDATLDDQPLIILDN